MNTVSYPIIKTNPVMNWCAICKERAYVAIIENDCDEYSCNGCGYYIVDKKASELLSSIRNKNEIAVNLRNWMLKNNENKISVDAINEVDKWRKKSINEKTISLLYEIEKKSKYPGYTLDIRSDIKWINHIKATCFFYDNNEFNYFIQHLVNMNYIENKSQTLESYIIRLLPRAFDYLDNISKTQDCNIGFCAMWFDQSTLPVYEKAIKPAIENSGYSPFRVDYKQYNNSVIDEIIANI